MKMLGKTGKQCSPWSQCRECKRGDGCRAGSKARKLDRKNARKQDKREFRKDLQNEFS